jgi:hypothetical protein
LSEEEEHSQSSGIVVNAARGYILTTASALEHAKV